MSGETALSDGSVALAAILADSGMRVGIAARDIAALDGADGAEAIAAGAAEAAALGGAAILLGSVRQASPTLDPAELRAAAAAAREHGVRLHANIGALHQRRWNAGLVTDTLAAAEDLEIEAFHVIFGLMEDRFSADPIWPQSLRAAVEPVRRLVDRAGRPLVIRTHEEMTTFELNRLIDEVDRPGISVGYSPVNVVCRVEDPVDAFDRVAGRVSTVFLDDGDLVRVTAGADRRLRPLGEGSVDWATVFDRLGRRSRDEGMIAILDLAQATFDVPFYDQDWLTHHDDLTVGEFARVVRGTRAAGPEQTDLARRRAVAREVLRLARERSAR